MAEVHRLSISAGLGMFGANLEHPPTTRGVGSFDMSDLKFTSGLAAGLHLLQGINAHEGRVIVIVAGQPEDLSNLPEGPLVRMHSACTFSIAGDNPLLDECLQQPVIAPNDIRIVASYKQPSAECDCKAQGEAAFRRIIEEGGVYFDLVEQEGRGAGLDVKRAAYLLQREEGLDTAQAYERLGIPFDTREYAGCAKFLLGAGIERVRLFTNNPRKIGALVTAGIEVTPEPLVVGVSSDNLGYLRTKRDKAGHTFPTDAELRILAVQNADSL